MWWIAVITIALIYGLAREIRKLPPPQSAKTPEDFEVDTTRNTMLWILAGTLVILTLIGLLWYWQRRSGETFDGSSSSVQRGATDTTARSTPVILPLDYSYEWTPDFLPSHILDASLGAQEKRGCAVYDLLAEHNEDPRALKDYLVGRVRACMKDRVVNISDPTDCNEKQRLFELLDPENNPPDL